MKKLIFLFMLMLSGCSSDLDIMQDYPTVPVVYAIINPYDSVHYVRVQRTFKIYHKADWATLCSDSLLFEDVEVFMYGKQGDSIKWVEQFAETSVTREDGFFPTEGFRSFYLDHPFPIHLSNPSNYSHGIPDIDSLVLEVKIPSMNITTRASSSALRPVKIKNYKSRYSIYVYGEYPSVYGLPTIESYDGHEYSVVFNQIEFRVHYREFYPNTVGIKEIFWKTSEGFADNDYFITPTRLFNPIKLALEDSDSVLARKLDSIDIALVRPSRFFIDYWNIREHWEEFDRPPYSNFDHSYGMLFTIVKDEWTGMQLFWRALDSLCYGQFYKEMKFIR